MRVRITVLVLLFGGSLLAGHSQHISAVQSTKPAASKPLDCTSSSGYTVAEVQRADASYVDITLGDKVLGSIRIFTDAERNGFALDEAKKTRAGFSISVEYGSRYYYHKRFIFICKQHKFYLSKVVVNSFDKQDPEHWSKKEIRINPIVPLEKFFLGDFMLEGVAK